jgi:hypothetical protein
VFAVGQPSRRATLELLARQTEVIEITDAIWKAFRLAEVAEPLTDPRNLTLAAAGHQLHQEARNVYPQLLRHVIDRIIQPLVSLGYVEEGYKIALDEWALLPAWTPFQRDNVWLIAINLQRLTL